jgi:hypothetical protein
MARMEYTNKLGPVQRSVLLAVRIRKMLCCVVLLGGKAGNTWFEVHTFLIVIYAHVELKWKTQENSVRV